MKAVTFNKGALGVRADAPLPLMREGEAMVRVSMAGICRTDLEIVRGYMGFSGTLGHEFVGIVTDCPSASDMTGRRVVGEINASCAECGMCMRGLPTHCTSRSVLGIFNRDGAMAERLTLPVGNLHLIPDSVSDEQAVFVEPLAAAFQILEQVRINKSDRVLVMGDGKLGLLCAMVLSGTGAGVTLLGRHESKLALARPYGVDTLLYGTDEPAAAYDMVVEATGRAEGFTMAMGLVRPRGTIVLKSTVADAPSLNLAPIVINELSVVGSRCGPFKPAIEAIASGAIDPSPLVEATYGVDEAVAAFEHAGRKGALKVLIRFS